MALTLKTAYDKKINKEFVGNIFDFIDPNIDDSVLMEIFPHLFRYMAVFIFKTNATANAFKSVVRPFLKHGNTVITYVNVNNSGGVMVIFFKQFFLIMLTLMKYIINIFLAISIVG